MKKQKLFSIWLVITMLASLLAPVSAVHAEGVSDMGVYGDYESLLNLLTYDEGKVTNDTANKRINFDSNMTMQLDNTKDYVITFRYKAAKKSSSDYVQLYLMDENDKRVLATQSFPNNDDMDVKLTINNSQNQAPSIEMTSVWNTAAPPETYSESGSTPPVSYILFRVNGTGGGRLYYDPAVTVKEAYTVTGTVTEGVRGVKLVGSDGSEIAGTIEGTAVTFTGVTADTYTVAPEYTEGYTGSVNNGTVTVSDQSLADAFTITAQKDVSAVTIEGTAKITSDNDIDNPQVNDVLTASAQITNSTSEPRYLWQSKAASDSEYMDIDGAEESAYTITNADIGKVIRAIVTTEDTISYLASDATGTVTPYIADEGEYSTYDDVKKLFTFEDGTTVLDNAGGMEFNYNGYINLDSAKDYEITFNLKSANNASRNYTQIFLLENPADTASSKRVLQTDNITAEYTEGVTITVNNTEPLLPSTIELLGNTSDGTGHKFFTAEEASATVSRICFRVNQTKANLLYEPAFTIKDITGQNKSDRILPNMFTENMVLQEGNSSVFGKGINGETYTAVLAQGANTYTASSVAAEGRFKAVIKDAPASMEPYTLTITSTAEGMEDIIINNVYVGEVYLLSGQSNMELRLAHNYGEGSAGTSEEDAQRIMNEKNYGSRIKFMTMGTKQYPMQQFDAPILNASNIGSYTIPSGTVPETWMDMKESTYKLVSTIGMYFAEDLLDNNRVEGPVGLICSAVNGTKIDTWMKNGDAGNYNGHIAPFEDYGIKGILWYQGESDGNDGEPQNAEDVAAFDNRFPQLVNDYRKAFGRDDLPFLYVQLASYKANNKTVTFDKIRNSQRLALDRVADKNNIAMAVSADTATTKPDNIHPNGKDKVAQRLYLAAAKLIYNDTDVVYEGPLMEKVEFEDNKAIIHFKESSVSGGLEAKGTLSNFQIAGEDKNFVWVKAENVKIADNTVELTDSTVPDPKYARYAPGDRIELTLYNGAGLPASPFTTEETIKITNIGDSITYGYGLSDRDNDSFPAVLRELLNSDATLGAEYSIYNRGKNSRTMGSTNYPYTKEQEWTDAKADRSDIYTIGLGTNDSKNGVEDNNTYNYKFVKDGTYAKHYMEMIDTIMEYNHKTEIYMMIPIPSLAQTQSSADDKGDINEARLTVIRDEIRKVYTQAHEKYGEQIKLIDLFKAFTEVIEGETIAEANTDKYTNPIYANGSETEFNGYATVNALYLYDKNLGGSDELLIDTIHPGKAGYALIAKTVYEAITNTADDEPEEPGKEYLTLLDRFKDMLRIEKTIDENGDIILTASSKNDEDVPELSLYLAVYSDNGVLEDVNKIAFDEENSAKVTKPENDNYKLFIWTANKHQPVTEAITQESVPGFFS